MKSRLMNALLIAHRNEEIKLITQLNHGPSFPGLTVARLQFRFDSAVKRLNSAACSDFIFSSQHKKKAQLSENHEMKCPQAANSQSGVHLSKYFSVFYFIFHLLLLSRFSLNIFLRFFHIISFFLMELSSIDTKDEDRKLAIKLFNLNKIHLRAV